MSANPTPPSDPPARLPGTEPITMRHVIRIVWPRTVWMLACTWPGLSLLAVLGVWLAVAVQLGNGVWQVVLLALAGCLVTLGLLPVFQLGVVARRQGRIGYATNTALLLVTHRGDNWFLGEHFSWPKGTGPAFRAALFPQLAAAALAAGVDVTATIASKRVYAQYERERWLEGADQAKLSRRWGRLGGGWAVRWHGDGLQAMAQRGAE